MVAYLYSGGRLVGGRSVRKSFSPTIFRTEVFPLKSSDYMFNILTWVDERLDQSPTVVISFDCCSFNWRHTFDVLIMKIELWTWSWKIFLSDFYNNNKMLKLKLDDSKKNAIENISTLVEYTLIKPWNLFSSLEQRYKMQTEINRHRQKYLVIIYDYKNYEQTFFSLHHVRWKRILHFYACSTFLSSQFVEILCCVVFSMLISVLIFSNIHSGERLNMQARRRGRRDKLKKDTHRTFMRKKTYHVSLHISSLAYAGMYGNYL